MPTDWLFYWMTLPTGLAVIAAAVALPFFLWRYVLGAKFGAIGFTPVAVAYLLAAVGLLAANFLSSHLEFSARVAKNILPEAERWSIVPGWTIYTSVLSLIVVLPLLGVVAVPATAWLVRLHRLSYASIAIAVVIAWLTLALLAWAFPSNEWHSTHRSESLAMWLKSLAPSVVLVGLPFLLGARLASREHKDGDA